MKIYSIKPSGGAALENQVKEMGEGMRTDEPYSWQTDVFIQMETAKYGTKPILVMHLCMKQKENQ